MEDDVAPTASGLLLCLRALADEASAAAMTQTAAAIRRAIVACMAERHVVNLSSFRAESLDTVH